MKYKKKAIFTFLNKSTWPFKFCFQVILENITKYFSLFQKPAIPKTACQAFQGRKCPRFIEGHPGIKGPKGGRGGNAGKPGTVYFVFH